MVEASTSLSPIASDGQVRMISCGADKSIYFRTAQKVRPLGVPDGAGVARGSQVTRSEGRQYKLCDLVTHWVWSAHVLPAAVWRRSTVYANTPRGTEDNPL